MASAAQGTTPSSVARCASSKRLGSGETSGPAHAGPDLSCEPASCPGDQPRVGRVELLARAVRPPLRSTNLSTRGSIRTNKRACSGWRCRGPNAMRKQPSATRPLLRPSGGGERSERQGFDAQESKAPVAACARGSRRGRNDERRVRGVAGNSSGPHAENASLSRALWPDSFGELNFGQRDRLERSAARAEALIAKHG